MTSSQASAIFRRTQFVGRTDSYLTISPNVAIQYNLEAGLKGVAPVDVSGSLMTDPYVQDSISRLGRYGEYMNFYAGRHHTIEYDGGDIKPTFNYPRRIVNKRATWITGRRGFQFVPRKGNEAVCEVLDSVWKANRKKSLIRRTAKVSLTCGDAFWFVTVKTKDAVGKKLPADKWYVRICPINPAYVFPLWCEDDPYRMKACMMQFPIWANTNQRVQLFTAVYTIDKVDMYLDNDNVSSAKNELGLIPIVHVPNGAFNDLPFGISALIDVIPVVRKYNDLVMQIGRIVKYHSDPTTIVYGTSLAKMEKAANRVWSNLPPHTDARVENLEMKGDLAATYRLMEEYQEDILSAGCTPQISYDAKKLATSNASGLAIQLLFQPLIEVTEEAQDEFTEGIQQVNQLIAVIYEKIFGMPLTELADAAESFLDSDITWPSMLPRDVTQEVDLISKMLDMGIISKAEAARRIAGITDTERAAVELAADNISEIALNMEKARSLAGKVPNFSAATLGSLFVNEDLLDIAGRIGDISTDAAEKFTGKSEDTEATTDDTE